MLDALCRVSRLSKNSFLLDAVAQQKAKSIRTQLERFEIRIDILLKQKEYREKPV